MHPGKRDEIQNIRDELDDLRAELDAVRSEGRRPWWSRAVRPRPTKRLTGIGLVALMLTMPVLVSASHQFTDVPTSHTFHSAISRIYGARLTTGCSSTKFCPGANVTRGQMAAFLNRGLGRAGSKEVVRSNDHWESILDFYPIAEALLLPGGGPGGTGHVWASGVVSLWTSEVGVCPCEVQAYLDADAGGRSELFFGMIGSEMGPVDPDDPSPRKYATTTLSPSHLFTVSSGAGNVFSIWVKVIPTKAPDWSRIHGSRADVQALYLPFGFDGAKAMYPQAQEPVQDDRP